MVIKAIYANTECVRYNISGALIEYALILFNKQPKKDPTLNNHKREQSKYSKCVNLEDDKILEAAHSDTKYTTAILTNPTGQPAVQLLNKNNRGIQSEQAWQYLPAGTGHF